MKPKSWHATSPLFAVVVGGDVERQGLQMTETTKMSEMDENHAAGGKQKPSNASPSRNNNRENLDKLTKVVPSSFFSLQHEIWIT